MPWLTADEEIELVSLFLLSSRNLLQKMTGPEIQMPIDKKMILAAGSFDTNTGAMVNNFCDGATPTYVGVGVSNITLEAARGGLDITDMALIATPRNAALRSLQYANTSDTVKVINCRDGAVGLVAAESGVDFMIVKLSAIDRRAIHAAGHYNGALAAGAVAYGERGGVVARTAAGIYTITLDRQIDASECVVLVTVGPGAAAATDLHPRVVHTSGTVKTVTIETLAAGADVDADFSWVVVNLLQLQQTGILSAGGSIAAAGGSVVGRGCVPLRNGAGDYQYALDRGFAAAEYAALATVIGATGMCIRTVNAANARKDVETQIQAAAAQTNCDNGLVILRLV
jgi:hypothetical protein